MTSWYVVQTQPHQESRAEINLVRQGYDIWCPRLRKTRRHARRVDTVLAPLFPGYIFLNMDPSKQAWRAINGTFGVKGILSQDSRPLPVPSSFIEELQRRTEKGGIVIQADTLRVGEEAVIEYGAFKECVGTILKITDSDRIMMMLKLLGREVRAIVSRQNVMAAGA